MHTIDSINVNDAYREGMGHLALNHELRESRNGPVFVALQPVTTRYRFPLQRVLFDAQRDANPFFHLFEALWMLAGRNDLGTLTYFLPRFKDFSDNGHTLHGAYGYRWRHFDMTDSSLRIDFDQLDELVQKLHANPADRRAVLQIWDARIDISGASKDIPCNLIADFAVNRNRLDMYVFNRSNDIVLGCYGANAVHFSFLLEYMAARIGVVPGVYEQISCNFHAYVESWTKYWPLDDKRSRSWLNPYLKRPLTVHPLVTVAETFDEELARCVDHLMDGGFAAQDCLQWDNTFFRVVAQPMLRAFRMYRALDPMTGAKFLDEHAKEYGVDVDWIVAGKEWLLRRKMRQLDVQLSRDPVDRRVGI